MSKTLKQSGNNSITYFVVTDGGTDGIGPSEWDALPPSRIKDVCGRVYTANNADAARLQMYEYLASEGFSLFVEISEEDQQGEINVIPVGEDPNRFRLVVLYPGGVDKPGIVRIALAYSASA